jgi:hypothetical protein
MPEAGDAALPGARLSWLARLGEAADGLRMYAATPPMKRRGRAIRDLFVPPSQMDFAVEDSDRRQIFAIFRASAAKCRLRIIPPVTPIVAFAMAIAIVTSD